MFDQGIDGASLVGGTALAGYYAGHRSSDDIDLFVKDGDSFRAAVLAVDSLTQAGAEKLEQMQSSKQFSKSHWLHEGHRFNVDIVLDENFFKVADLCLVGKMQIASLFDLLRMKMATLVSRGSEKDLYDLMWLFDHFQSLSLQDKLSAGAAIDSGLTAENALVVLSSNSPQQVACSFATEMGKPASSVFREIGVFRKKMIADLVDIRKASPARSGIPKIKKSLGD